MHTNVAGCVLFAAVSGSSVATTATIGKITTRALAERKYDVNLSVGSVAAAGSIGIMIPPSITMIIYGMIAEVSVAKLFAAGMFPGLLLGVLYSGFIAARCMLRPALAPTPETRPTMKQRLLALGDLLPVLFLILLVLGGIYTGLATPSEAAALGVVGALCITVSTGQLTWAVFVESAMSAVKITAMLGTAFAAAALLSTTMGFLHVPQTIATFIAGLDLTPVMLLVVLGAFYILLGCVLESISLILMTMPISYPLIVQAGFDPVWFGVFLVLVIEMGLITPPIGFNLFVLRGITGHPIGRIAWGSVSVLLAHDRRRRNPRRLSRARSLAAERAVRLMTGMSHSPPAPAQTDKGASPAHSCAAATRPTGRFLWSIILPPLTRRGSSIRPGQPPS